MKRVGRGEFDPELAAHFGRGLDSDISTHAKDGAFYDGKADASSLDTGGGATAGKHLEEAFAILFGNAQAVVTNVQTHFAFEPLGPDFNPR